MHNFNTILTTLRRPFQQETRKGCRDDVVVNGLGDYVRLWVKKGDALSLTPDEQAVLRRLDTLFADYARLSPDERQAAIQDATREIDTALSGTSPQAGNSSRVQESTPPVSAKKPNTAPTANLPLFRAANRKPHQSSAKNNPSSYAHEENLGAVRESSSPYETENQAVSVPISDVPVSTDVDELAAFRNSLQYLKGIGPRRARLLQEELEIHSVQDLLAHYPRDYIDRSKTVDIYNVGRTMDGEPETIQGKVVNHTASSPSAKGKTRVGKVSIYDGTGVAVLVNFGRRIGYIKSILPIDTEVVVSGKFSRRYNEIQATDYEFEVFDEDNETLIHTKRIVPKYALTAKLTAKMVRTWMRTALDTYGHAIPEILPVSIRHRQQLVDRQTAVNEIHFPTSEAHRLAAQKRLAFDEFFLLSLGMELKKDQKTSQKGIPFRIEKADSQLVGNDAFIEQREGDGINPASGDMPCPSLLRQFVDALPFALTGAQRRVFNEIAADMQSPKVMNRLLQGDVGSGKTVVAAMALLGAIQNGYQGALMVPTEILAEQHYNNLSSLLTPLGLNVVLLKSDLPKVTREAALAAITEGTAHLIVGTQALIQEGVDFHKLGIAIIDEQHRFGVMQRATLRHKGQTPDVLVMTATPIPRTLSLTIYGDLNVSVIDELPPGRQKIETTWVKENERQKLYAKLEREVRKGKQAYIVYPLVEESEKLEALKAATSMAEHFQNDVFPHLRVGLIHGQMKAAEKQATMAQFKARQIDILVATTVIEVGIDVPNATLMVIEHAERFGLAQLHQLRGRVGRGRDKSACYLVATPRTDDAYRRVQVMVRTNNGFEIAEEDLNIRGPGEFFGTKQAGIPNFKIANILKDATLLEAAKQEAARVVAADAKLHAPEHQLLKHLLQTSMRSVIALASIG